MKDFKNIFLGEKKQNKKQIIVNIENAKNHIDGIINLAKSIEPKFELNEQNKGIFNCMFHYFTGNEVFYDDFRTLTKNEGSFNKGLMLVGGVGTGKTLLFKVFKEYSKLLRKNSFTYYDSIEIVSNVSISGADYLEKFNINSDNLSNNTITCYIDDIASTNEQVNNYGTKYNVIEQLLSIRYIVFSKMNKLTHVSTNKTPKELKDIYEERIIDRMKEMFNIIELKGRSFRK